MREYIFSSSPHSLDPSPTAQPINRPTHTDPSPEITRRTFRVELVRSVPIGILETLLGTLAVLFVLRVYRSGVDMEKPAPVKTALDRFESLVDELEELL